MNKGTIAYSAPGGGTKTREISSEIVECMEYGDFTHLTGLVKTSAGGRIIVEEWRVLSARVIEIHLTQVEAAK